MPNSTSDKASLVVARIEATSRNWKWLYRLWWAIHYGVGIIGIISGLAAGVLGSDMASAKDVIDKINIAAPGAIAALCATLVTFLGPVQKAERYWQAFQHADQALLDYDAGAISIAQVADAMRNARKIVLIGAAGHGDA